MATVDAIREEVVPPPIKEFRLTLTPKEAETVLAILCSIGGYDGKGGRRDMIDQIAEKMKSNGVSYKKGLLSGYINIVSC